MRRPQRARNSAVSPGLRFPFFEVLPQCCSGHAVHRNDALAAPLAHDAHRSVGEVQVREIKAHELGQASPEE
jgi:hypothetical protein